MIKDTIRFGLLILLGLWFLLSLSPHNSEAAIIKRSRLTVTATGEDGSATGSDTTDEVIQGQVVRVDIDYDGTLTTTTDLTLSESDDLIATNVINRSNSVTDASVFPTVGLTNNAGTAVTYDGTRPIVDYYPVVGKLTASLAQTTAATPAVTIDIYWREDK